MITLHKLSLVVVYSNSHVWGCNFLKEYEHIKYKCKLKVFMNYFHYFNNFARQGLQFCPPIFHSEEASFLPLAIEDT